MTRSQRYRFGALCRRLALESRRFWPHIGLTFAISLLASPLALLTPVPLKIAVDTVLGQEPLPPWLARIVPDWIDQSETGLLIFAAGLMLGVAFFTYLQGLALWILQTYTGENIALGFRSKLFLHLQRLSLSYHDIKGTSDALYRVQYDAPAVQFFALNGAIPFVAGLFTLSGMIYVASLISWELALVALAVCPILFFLTATSGRLLRKRWYDLKNLESSAMAVVTEALSALRIVKAFGKEEHEDRRFVHHSRGVVREQVHLAAIEGGFDMGVALTIAVGTAAVLVLGVRQVQTGGMTLGELLMVMAYLTQLYQPLQMVSKKMAELQSWLAGAERVFSVLDEVPNVADRTNASPIVRAKGAIAFNDVSFAYDGQGAALTDVSFDVPAGARVGIYGTTGAGKSTLNSLLFRFYDPTTGVITLDGRDLRDYRLADLRNQFAIVLQEPILFSASIAENIAYARSTATREEIEAAARAANAHDFITGLAQGYETLVGERGMRVSGGERQRIALARAFLRDSPILVLDEPTSAVDTDTEAGIIEAMERLMKGRTTFIIAHRLATLRNCDLFLRIERGRLVQINMAPPFAVVEGKANRAEIVREVS